MLLPEDPQLAPLPHSPGGSRVELIPPPRAHHHSESSAGPSRHHGDERSDAENMTKRERGENRLPRLTAYATAEGYRLKLLQAFLKREHGVGVVRVFDDCVYAVYHMPLLPGYGASTKVRSSPNVKSPGGVSLLERMTMAEDAGYNDSYFPSADPEDPQSNTTLEYILSHSPPSGMHGELMTNRDIPAGHSEEREDEIEVVQETLEARDGMEDEPIEELRQEEDVGIKAVLEHQLQQAHDHGPIGTHMDPNNPGYLEHVPSPAYSPQELSTPTERQPSDVHTHSQPPQRSSLMALRNRRKSQAASHGKIAEAVFFEYGVSVFFGFGPEEERDIMEDCEGAGTWIRGQDEDDWEQEEFHYTVSHQSHDDDMSS